MSELLYNFKIKNNTPDQAEITDKPPMSQDFPPVLPGNGFASAQAAGGDINGTFTIAFTTVKFICTYSFESVESGPQFQYKMEGLDSERYVIFPAPTPASIGSLANAFISIKQYNPV